VQENRLAVKLSALWHGFFGAIWHHWTTIGLLTGEKEEGERIDPSPQASQHLFAMVVVDVTLFQGL
jgi:hypothetical protein